MFRIPIIADSMQINRFLKLRNVWHVTDLNDASSTDRIWKVRPLYEAIREWALQLELETDLCVDEHMVPFKGNCKIKQYVKKKPSPWGLKLFVSSGKSGTVFYFIVSQGSKTEINYFYSKFGSGPSMVKQLCERINVPNCRLYFYLF